MLAYIIRRLLVAIPIFFGITVLTWLISTTNPDGGPLTAYLGKGGGKIITQQQIQAIERKLGLDQPLPVRYVYWVRNLFRGDLGTSITEHKPVTAAISERILPTVLLLTLALILQEIIAIPLGIFSALRRGSFFDQTFTVVAYVLFALPTFWYGLMMIVIFGVALRWFPFNGMIDDHLSGTAFGTPSYWAYFHTHTIEALVDLIRHLVMPVVVLATAGLAGDSRFMRASMLSVMNQDYIRTAKAKGLPNRMVVWKHALRNAILPIVTNIGLAIPTLIAGAVVTEQIFAWPGMGRLFVNAAQGYDYPVVIAYVVLIGALTLLFNIITDVSYAFVDPRIRYS